jgi:hypothetical protein
MIQLPNGSTLQAYYDPIRKDVVFEVLVKAHSYLAIGFIAGTELTNMAFWNANGANSKMMDMSAKLTIAIDIIENNYNTTMTLLEDGSVHYISRR